jgi:hypothetical protein
MFLVDDLTTKIVGRGRVMLSPYPLIGAYYISNVILFMSALGH